MIKYLFRAVLALTLAAGVAAASEEPKGFRKLNVTIVEGRGTCFLDGQWIPVEGQRVYWQVTGQKPVWHEYNKFVPSDAIKGLTRLSTESYFRIPLINRTSEQMLLHLKKIYPEISVAENLGMQTDRKDLLPARLIERVSEAELYNLNKLNDESPFRDGGSDRRFDIPTRLTGCDIKLDYKMNGATAFFRRGLFGAIEIVKDETKPYRSGTKTFAESLLSERRDLR
jgi:hypothetical protein